MYKKPGIILLIVTVLVSIISIYLATTPLEGNKAAAFSSDSAWRHLQQIARAPHSLGTPANALVRSYIIEVCSRLGLTVDTQHTTGLLSYGSQIIAGDVYNIIARIKGQQNSKAVLLAAHYDSQPNTFGAGDDGGSCAAMLETARLIKNGKPLKNDVVFLFTDGEEEGLLGAHGFVQESPVLKEVGVMLNFDNRGNSGVVNMFETNPENGWVMEEYARAAAHPFANSLNYEVYKLLPNSTDYTVFKNAGIAGLNNAVIEGFVNYHSMTDRPENLNRNSFQQTGENMVSMVRHFGNLDIRNTKAPDMSYFNILGDWLIRYPASWNLFIIVLANLLFIGTLLVGYRKKKISVKGVVSGMLIFLLTLVLLAAAGYFTLEGIRKAYPLYDHFYSANSYNAYTYFFALTALGVTIFCLIYLKALRKIPLPSLMGGILLTEVLCLDLLYGIAPTAIYFLVFPLLFVMAGWLIFLLKGLDEVERERPWSPAVLHFVFLIPAILLLAPLIYLNYIAFGLTGVSAVSLVLLGLLSGLLLPVFDTVFKTRRWLIPGFSLTLFVLSLLIAHIGSGFSVNRPLQTNIRYQVNSNEGKAYWISDFPRPDDFTRQFFQKSRAGHPVGGYYGSLINDAPLLDLARPTVRVEKDTLEKDVLNKDKRRIYLHCQAREGVVSLQFLLSDSCPASRIVVEGKEAKRQGPGSHTQTYRRLTYYGLTKEGITVMFEIEPGRPFDLDVVDRSIGLPEVPGYKTGYSSGVIPAPDYNSNTVQLSRHFRF